MFGPARWTDLFFEVTGDGFNCFNVSKLHKLGNDEESWQFCSLTRSGSACFAFWLLCSGQRSLQRTLAETVLGGGEQSQVEGSGLRWRGSVSGGIIRWLRGAV